MIKYNYCNSVAKLLLIFLICKIKFRYFVFLLRFNLNLTFMLRQINDSAAHWPRASRPRSQWLRDNTELKVGTRCGITANGTPVKLFRLYNYNLSYIKTVTSEPRGLFF